MISTILYRTLVGAMVLIASAAAFIITAAILTHLRVALYVLAGLGVCYLVGWVQDKLNP